MATNNKYEYTLPIGTILTGGQHSYKVVEVLGQGGFGITYKVSAQVMMGNIPVNVFFAVKEHFVKGHCYRGNDRVTMEYSKASKSEVEESLEDFKKEANRLKDICKRNKNVVNVNEVFFSNNTAYYVMEYIDGGDLRKLILNHKGGISEQVALSIIIPIANAVSYIHQQGIMHLDIKPDNIVIRNNTKEPVLIDFGVSLHFNKKGELTTTHVSTGASAGFAPQEQFAGITRFAPEVDVYALAATLFYLLVGRDPKSAFDIKEGDIEKALPNTVNEKTREAIVHGMKKEGYQRTQTAKDFVSALQGKFHEQPILTPLPANYVLHLGVTDYLIVRTQEIGNSYIKYQAVRYAGQYYGAGSNMTIKKTYPIYEFFAKGVHERQKDNSVVEKGDSSEARKDFSSLSYKIIGEGLSETYKIDSHIFKTNGTYYFVEEKKPVPPIPIWKYVRIGVGVLLLGIVSFMSFNMYQSCKGNRSVNDTVVERAEKQINISSHSVTLPDGEICIWRGSLIDEKPSGIGVLEYDENDKDGRKEYRGTMKLGKREAGNATLSYRNGNVYEGSFKNDNFEEGKLVLQSEGMYFVGKFTDNQPCNGKWFFTNGELYSTVTNCKER